ncbi:MAG: hypothetical protein R3E96_15935 [Planctomycetota bacterium]
MPTVPSGPGETILWLDADFDEDLDLLVPGYPPTLGVPTGIGSCRTWGPSVLRVSTGSKNMRPRRF